MNATIGLFENPTINHTLKSQFKLIKKSAATTETVLDELSTKLQEKYTITRSSSEISIKIDKRKNLEQVKSEVQSILDEIEVTFNMEYLFKVLSGPNDIIVRARRN